jgi:hypothetical protein
MNASHLCPSSLVGTYNYRRSSCVLDSRSTTYVRGRHTTDQDKNESYHLRCCDINESTVYQFLLSLDIRRGVGTAMGWTAEVWFRAGEETFLVSAASGLPMRPAEPLIQWVSGALSLGVKLAVCEGDHSPPSSAEVKNGGAIFPSSIHLQCMLLN